MPRQPREYSSIGIYHVMVRGNERKDIFHGNDDREKFLNILEQKKGENEYDLYAYCLMNNHVHLIVKENKDNITRIMKRINTSYASYYNKKYGRVGHVFQDRYKSEPIEEERYLLEVIRYVHNNPVKGKLVESPQQYPWSSFHIYMDNRKHKLGLVACGEVLEMYSQNKKTAIQKMVVYTTRQGNENILDVENDDKEQGMKMIIARFLKENKTDLQQLNKDKSLRNELIKILKERSGGSIRVIAEVLGVNRNIIQRTVKGQ